MINYAQIRDSITTNLNSFMNIPIVMGEQNDPKPPYPYLSCKFTGLYVANSNHSAELQDTVTGTNGFPYDIQLTRLEQMKLILEVTAYSETMDEAENKIYQALDWFNYSGYQTLKDNGLIVFNIGQVQDQDTFIVDDYEHRKTFDVTLRIASETVRTLETIESVQYND
jgi:hypothetical protein